MIVAGVRHFQENSFGFLPLFSSAASPLKFMGAKTKRSLFGAHNQQIRVLLAACERKKERKKKEGDREVKITRALGK